MCSVPGVPTPGSEVSVLITRVNLNLNCGLVELWVNMNSETKYVNEQMTEDIQTPTRHFCESEGKPGNLCLVNIGDTWHRARIVSIQNETYNVFLIDQGQPHSATSEALAWGKDEYFILPPEVESCVLANVLLIKNNWPDRVTNFLKSLPGKQFMGLAQHALMPERTILLDLPTVSKHLCKEGVLKKIPVEEFKILVQKCLNLPKEDHPGSCQITKEQSLNVSNQLENDRYIYLELLTNAFETIRVTEVINPENIFCELVIFSKSVKRLSEQVNEECEYKWNEKQAQPETFGAPCAAKGRDGRWRRAVLRQHVASKDATVEVLFVDEGKTEVIPAANIKPLPRRFLRMPVITYRCCLVGVHDNGSGWTTEQTNYLKALILNQTLVARFDHHNLPEDTYSISLYEPNAACVNDFFLEKDGHFPRKRELELNGDGLQRENLSNRFIINGTASDVASPGIYPNKKSLRQDSFVQSNGYNSPSSLLEMALCNLLTVGRSVSVRISCIESLQKFWCQTAQSDRKLNVLMKDLQTYYTSAHPKTLVESLCVARNPDDNMWYRAKIITNNQSPDVEVRLIDYGQTKQVPLRDLCPIDPTFLKLDAQAFPCRLFDLPPTDVNDAKEFQKFVDSGTAQNSGLKCVVKAITSDEEGMLLNVVDIQTQSESASQVLAEKCAKKTTTKPLSDSYSYSNDNIEFNTKEKVWISSSENVHHFYCQLVRNSHLFKQVMEDTEKLLLENAPSDFPLATHDVCFARYTDTMWYRGQIIEISPDIKVHFMDYGKTLTINKTDIRPFPSEATVARSVPVLAIPLALYNIPEEVSQEVNQWFAEKAVGNNFTMSVQKKEPNGKLIVELFNGSVCVNAQVREKMVKTNAMKVTRVVEDTNQQLSNGSKQRPVSNGKVQISVSSSVEASQQNGLQKSTKSINIEGLDATKTAKSNSVSRQVNAAEGVFEKTSNEGRKMGPALKEKQDLSSTLLNEEHYKTKITQSPTVSPERNLNICVYKKPIVSINKTEELFASSISGPEHFWCQCSNTGDLEKVTRLAQEEGLAQQDPNFPKALVPGSPCLALFSSDNQWYRAQVINRTKDTLSVLFVDYGNELDVHIKDVRPLPLSMLEVAPQAFLCCLDGVEESKDLWDDAFYDSFYNLLIDKPLKVKVLFMGNSSEVKVPQYTVQIDDVAVHKLMQKYWKSDDGNVLTISLQRETVQNENIVPQNTTAKVSEAKVKMCFYKKPNILLNKTVEVYASSISGPAYFWCQYSNFEVERHKVTQLAQQGGMAEDPVFPESLVPGSPCLAVFSSDNQWYRAQVINRSKNTLSVVFIDYGNELDVHINDVRPLPPILLEVPPQAFLCCLDKFDESLGWDDALYDYFYNCLVNKLLKVKVLDMEHNEEVRVPQYSVQFDFDQLFVEKLLKNYSKPKDKKEITKSFQTENVPQNVQKDSQKTPLKVSDVNVKMCRYINPKVVMNKTVEAIASSISGPEYFWCRCSNTGELENVTKLAQKGQMQQDSNFPQKIVPGSPCLALSSKDNQWHRAQVINRTKDTLSVVFVDCGNEADINSKHVRPLPLSLQEVAPQAFLCCLDGFEESKGSWDDAVYDEFYNILVDKPLKVTAFRTVDKEVALPQYVVQIQCGNTAVNKTMQEYWRPNVKTDNHQAQSSVKSDQNDSKVTLTNVSGPNGNLQKMYPNPSVCLNRTEEVYASCIVEPHYFWCQFSNTAQLNKIIKLAQEAGRSQQHPETLNSGSPCLALFSSDNQWYRALINNKTGDTLNVVFIDYGNEADVGVKDVRSTPQSLLDEAPQAFLCTLHGFDQSRGSWDDQIYNDFYNLLVDKLLKIKTITVENNPNLAVPQYSVQVECDGANVNKLMETYWRERGAGQAKPQSAVAQEKSRILDKKEVETP